MNTLSFNGFECHLYISARGAIKTKLPATSAPRHVASLEPAGHDALIDPSFRRLLAAFESVAHSRSMPQTVQV